MSARGAAAALCAALRDEPPKSSNQSEERRLRVRRWSTHDRTYAAVLLVLSVSMSLLIAALLLQLTGSPPGVAFEAMVRGSVGSKASLASTFNHTAPLLLVAVGASIAGRAALLNIGQEGQLTIGAMLGTAVALQLSGPGIVVIPAVLLAAAAGGALWAGLAALMRYGRGINEVISTLLLNFIAFQMLSFAVNRPWLLQETRRVGSAQALSPQSDPIPDIARLPVIATGPGYRVHAGILLAIIATALVAGVLARTRLGFNVRALGMNERAARRAGVNPPRIGGLALLASGAFAGLAGAIMLTGSVFRVQTGFSNNYGWEGLLVALVAGFSPLLTVPVAFLFGALRSGGGVLAATGASPAIVGVIQALIVLAVVVPGAYVRMRNAKPSGGRSRVLAGIGSRQRAATGS